MREVEEVLASVLPRLKTADTALHNGDPGPRQRMWAHNGPVTLFGAVWTASGWAEVGPIFERLAAKFSNCESFEYEVLAADAGGDLAYIVGIERTTASIGGAPPQAYELRVTTILRRENGEWKVVHRHGDPCRTAKRHGCSWRGSPHEHRQGAGAILTTMEERCSRA